MNCAPRACIRRTVGIRPRIEAAVSAATDVRGLIRCAVDFYLDKPLNQENSLPARNGHEWLGGSFVRLELLIHMHSRAWVRIIGFVLVRIRMCEFADCLIKRGLTGQDTQRVLPNPRLI